METDAASSSVFNLYQEGLESDQVLQLCFLRRRAPRRLRLGLTPIEDEFVLPRPELKIASLFPPADFQLERLVSQRAPISQQQASNSADEAVLSSTTIDQVRESARRHFLQPRRAAVEDVRQWAALVESDWLQIHRSLRQFKIQRRRQDAKMPGIAPTAQVPEVADVCWMLEQCPSDALVGFVWDHLLVPLLQQCVGSNTSQHQLLFRFLVSSHSFASLSPKDFRAKVRSRNLRQVDDAFGAQAELALIALYRRQRDGMK